MSNGNALHARTGQTLKNRLNKLNASGVLPGGGGMPLGWRNHKMFPGRGSIPDDLKGVCVWRGFPRKFTVVSVLSVCFAVEGKLAQR